MRLKGLRRHVFANTWARADMRFELSSIGPLRPAFRSSLRAVETQTRPPGFERRTDTADKSAAAVQTSSYVCDNRRSRSPVLGFSCRSRPVVLLSLRHKSSRAAKQIPTRPSRFRALGFSASPSSAGLSGGSASTFGQGLFEFNAGPCEIHLGAAGSIPVRSGRGPGRPGIFSAGPK